MYQRALALIAALLAVHCAWSAMNVEEISAPEVALAKIAAIAPARLVGLRRTSQRFAPEATARETSESLNRAPAAGLIAANVSSRRGGGLAVDASWSP